MRSQRSSTLFRPPAWLGDGIRRQPFQHFCTLSTCPSAMHCAYAAVHTSTGSCSKADAAPPYLVYYLSQVCSFCSQVGGASRCFWPLEDPVFQEPRTYCAGRQLDWKPPEASHAGRRGGAIDNLAGAESSQGCREQPRVGGRPRVRGTAKGRRAAKGGGSSRGCGQRPRVSGGGCGDLPRLWDCLHQWRMIAKLIVRYAFLLIVFDPSPSPIRISLRYHLLRNLL